MTDVANPAAAAAALADPNTSPTDLAEIARLYPEYGPKVAVHPNGYPGLLDWLGQYGNDATRAAAQQVRQSKAEPADMTILGLQPENNGPGVDKTSLPLASGVPVQASSPMGSPSPNAAPALSGTAVPTPTTPSPNVARDAASELKQTWKGDSNDKAGSWLGRLGIIWSAGKFLIIAVVVVVVAIFGIHSCAATSSAKNVTCSQFNAMSLSAQQDTLNALLSAHKKQTGGSNLVVCRV